MEALQVVEFIEFKDFKEKIRLTKEYDRNGKEIYEGDIVKQHYFYQGHHPKTLGVMEKESEIIGKVMIDDPDDLSALGCMGISHVENDKDLIQGAGEYDFDKVTLLIKGDTLKEWAEEQNYIDGPEGYYEVIDDEY